MSEFKEGDRIVEIGYRSIYRVWGTDYNGSVYRLENFGTDNRYRTTNIFGRTWVEANFVKVGDGRKESDHDL